MIEPIDGSIIYQVLKDGTIWGHDAQGRIAMITTSLDVLGLVSGQTILDLGSNAGHFPITYLRLGAEKVYAVEGRKEFEIQWESIKEQIHGVNCDDIEWTTADVRKFTTQKKYTIISCLGLTYHVDGMLKILSDLVTDDVRYILVESQLWYKPEWQLEFPSDRTRALEPTYIRQYTVVEMDIQLTKYFNKHFYISRVWGYTWGEAHVVENEEGERSAKYDPPETCKIRAFWLLSRRMMPREENPDN